MTEPSRPRPVPGPPRPGPAGGPVPGPARPAPPAAGTAAGAPHEPATGERYADLAGRPVAEHVAVFEAEHDRLQRELATIDQL
ncbi:hypothetical protein SAMN05660464_1245 [Geodermatophilus dictyosporus]|uniref:Uncharacterized protein n=1 Tax=Geodermatophilus dictyosporus TaxID=1523247 RepID=A0A1I5K3D7_9ACTN|nr:hypothetical protein [Geodermatophilus dictyosporus]SFO79565.1 hypothetical protein SAMN05660464_1245 [Geodermatophilus dictyosporus]